MLDSTGNIKLKCIILNTKASFLPKGWWNHRERQPKEALSRDLVVV